MKQYLDLMQQILDKGNHREDRTGVGTRAIFGAQMRFDLKESFPLLTTKKLHLKSIIHELIWFLSGDTNIKYLQENGVTIWDSWRRPYTLDRPYVFVEKKHFPYQEYKGDFSLGKFEHSTENNKLASAWARMMHRCYDPEAHNYRFYGAKGVSVCKRWHEVQNYINDVKTLPHWWYKQHDWNSFQLDKDYFGSNQYNPESCVWLRTDENVPSEAILLVSPNGESFVFLGASEASSFLGISRTTTHRFLKFGFPSVLKGNNKKIEGWHFYKFDEEDNQLPRRALIKDGDLGKIYGAQWRNFSGDDTKSYHNAWINIEEKNKGVDQIANVLTSLKEDPFSRRHIICAWNPAQLDQMALPPCHALAQFFVREENGKRYLSCQLYQRSCDFFLGVPFNIASYSLLTHIFADCLGYIPDEFVWTGGDVHLYDNHIEQAKLQLSRTPLPPSAQLHIRNHHELPWEYKFDDFEITGYESYPAIKAPIAV